MSPIIKDMNITFHVDDMLIGSSSLKQHTIDLEKFLQLAKRINLTLDIKKSSIATDDIEWCGFRFHEGLVSPAPSRLDCLDSFCFPKIADNGPKSKAYNRVFGKLQFFRKFVKNYTHLAAKMTQLVDQAWDTENLTVTFQSAQIECDKHTRDICSLIKSSALTIVTDKDELVLRTDASSLSYAFQLYRKSDRTPIAFGGKSFSAVEQQYPPFCRELLGLRLGVQKTLPYIHVARSCEVESDNWIAVQNINGCANELNSTAMRLISDLIVKTSDPKITVKHLAGIKMVVSDCLSRLKFPKENQCTNPVGEELRKINLVDMLSEDKEIFDICGLRKILVLTPRARQIMKQKVIVIHNMLHSCPQKLYKKCISEGLSGRGLYKLCCEIVDECSFCYLEKKLLAHNILGKTTTPKKELRQIHIDHVHLPLSQNNNQYLITVVDPFSKYFFALPVPSLEMEYVQLCLQTFLIIFGSVHKIRGDRAFVSLK